MAVVRAKDCCYALMMSLHPRLGAESPVRHLNCDLLRKILDWICPALSTLQMSIVWHQFHREESCLRIAEEGFDDEDGFPVEAGEEYEWWQFFVEPGRPFRFDTAFCLKFGDDFEALFYVERCFSDLLFEVVLELHDGNNNYVDRSLEELSEAVAKPCGRLVDEKVASWDLVITREGERNLLRCARYLTVRPVDLDIRQRFPDLTAKSGAFFIVYGEDSDSDDSDEDDDEDEDEAV